MIFPPWWGYGYFLELHIGFVKFEIKQCNGSRLTKTKFVRGLVSLDCRLRLLENYFCIIF